MARSHRDPGGRRPDRGPAPGATRAAGRGGRPRGLGWGAVVVLAVLAAALAWDRGARRQAPSTATHGTPPASVAGPAMPPSAAGPVIPDQAVAFAAYGGSASCRECHAAQHAAWQASHHGLAERGVDAALDRSAFDPPRDFVHGTQRTEVRWDAAGAGSVRTPGSTGVDGWVRVERVIGHAPLRQFLVGAEGGRWQTLEASWDPRGGQWFNVFGGEDRKPGEWGHWTGRGMNWNSMCGTCHNTRFRKNYDPGADAYASAMAERTVGCESCHGPMAEHGKWQRAWQGSGKGDPTLGQARLTPAQRMESCAPCHARRSELTGDYVPGDSFWDHFHLAMVDGGNVFYADGQIREEDYEYAPYLGSRMHAAGVTCMDCHDPHTSKVRETGNALCLRCHNGTRPGTPVIDPVAHSHHGAESTGNQCVNCHMPQTVYMQLHARHDHGFTTPDPALTLEHGIPNACNRCHQDKDATWAKAAAEQWYGARLDRPSARRARTMARAAAGDEGVVPQLLGLLESPEVPYWRAAAAGLLARWAMRDDVGAALARQLTHAHPLVRAKAVEALAGRVEAGDGRAAAAVRGRGSDGSRVVRHAAAWVMRGELDPGSRGGRELAHQLALHSDQPAGQAQWGAYQMARGRADLALAHYAKAAAWDPGSPVWRSDQAVALSALGRAEEAVRSMEAAVALEPTNPDLRFRLALALGSVPGRLGEVVAALEHVLRLDARHARAAYNLGLAYHERGESERALDALARSESLDGRDPSAPYAAATVLWQAGRVSEARAAAERALRLDPRHAGALELLRNAPER